MPLCNRSRAPHIVAFSMIADDFLCKLANVRSLYGENKFRRGARRPLHIQVDWFEVSICLQNERSFRFLCAMIITEPRIDNKSVPSLDQGLESGAGEAHPAIGRQLHFDSIRAFMFIAVFLGHVTTAHISTFFGSSAIYVASSFGFYGYLVLSGFLITRILIGSDTGQPWKDVSNFWMRRTLRIFPIYYLTLLVLFFCGQLPQPLSFITYLSNVHYFILNKMGGPTSHLWSLAVEEQYYLLFPLAFVMTPRKHRLAMIILLLCACLAIQSVCVSVYPYLKWKLLLPSAGHCILMGALAGYFDMKLKPSDETRLLIVAVLANLILMTVEGFNRSLVQSLLLVNGASIAVLVYALWRTRNQFIRNSLSNKLLVHLGRTSYAMYLFHLPILYLLIDFPIELKIVVGFVATALLATLSWYFFESPINDMRNRLIPSRY